MTTLALNTRLILDDTQKDALIELLSAHQDAYNVASEIRFYEGTKNSIIEMHTLFYNRFRSEHPEVPSQVVIRAERECLAAYRTAKSNKHKIDQPVQRKHLSMGLDKRLYSYRDEKFSLPTLSGRIKGIEYHHYPRLDLMLSQYEMCDPSLFVRKGEVWMTFKFKIPTYKCEEKLAVGVDLGIRVAAATSEGRFYGDRKFNGDKRKVRYLKRMNLSKAKQGSRKARRNLKRLSRKEHNKNKNQSHALANAILRDTEADVIVLEDLKGIKKKKKPWHNKNRISQVPFYQLRMILAYKAPLMRKTVMTVEPAYTSQMDHRTKKRDGVREGRRYYAKDGLVFDADFNAAVNIADRSKLPVSYVRVLDGQAVVNQPDASKLEASLVLQG